MHKDLYYADVLHDEMMIEKFEKEMNQMERKIIDLKDITFEQAEKLNDYVWTNNKLIPTEMIEGD